MNPGGIHRLQCKTCNKSYVGRTGRSSEIRHGEHIRYIKTNNALSAYALHILNNSHEYVTQNIPFNYYKHAEK